MTSARSGKFKLLFQLLPDIIAVIGTLVVFTVATVTNISNDTLIQTTCGALVLFSVTLLVMRATTFAKMDATLTELADTVGADGPVRAGMAKQVDDLQQLVKFLTDGGLDHRLLKAAATANGYLQNFQRVGVVGAYPTLSEVNLAEEMRTAKNSIRIIATWTGCLIPLSETLVRKAHAGCDIRILILRHDSDFARLRGLELDPTNEFGASRQIATEMCEFNRLFHEHQEIRTRLRVKAFDARPPMCMFAHDEVRLIGALWPGINAMDGPTMRVVGDGDRYLSTSMGIIADREFERLWHDETTLYVKVVNGDPQYTDVPAEAWSTEGEYFGSIIGEIEQAVRMSGEAGRARAIEIVKADPEKIRVAVLELHQKLRSNRDAEAAMIVMVLEEIDELWQAESVLQEAVNSGNMQYLNKLLLLQRRYGKAERYERTLRRAVRTGNSIAISRLIELLESTDRSDEVEHVLRVGAEAGSADALTRLVACLDRADRSPSADRLLQQKLSEGDPHAGRLLALREPPPNPNGESRSADGGQHVGEAGGARGVLR